jgi:TonB family protein
MALGTRARIVVVVVAVVAAMLSARTEVAAGQRVTAPRLREGRLPAQVPEAYGGGEVVLELTVDPRGTVTRVGRARGTPPYTDLVAASTGTWRFEPAAVTIEGRPTSVPASVLVVAIFRPPSFYAGPAPGAPPEVLGATSPRVPRPTTLVMPGYPPTATGGGMVLVEIEMSGRGEPRGYRTVGPVTGFDAAALDAVRAWRFDAPQAPDTPDPLYVYAVVGFRAPLAPVTPQRR